jgi:drug/metabolite transporter (DMT)-like permease
MGVYVAFFAVVSVLAGAIGLHEKIAPSTWAGLGLIILGGLMIQFGSR